MDTIDTNELEHITPRQLRALLFQLDQYKTVKEVRAMLFDIPEQDKAYQIGLTMNLQMKRDSGHGQA